MTVKDFFNTLTYDSIKTHFAKNGHKFFDNGDYNVNVFGFRLTIGTNVWDDVIGIAYRENGEKKVVAYEASTDPGFYYLEHLLNENGCAILVPGQYRSSHKIRLHSGRYEALGQCGPLRVFRDGDLDNEHDLDSETIQESSSMGLNVHHGYNAKYVERNSAGCQVIRFTKDFDEFMHICRMAAATWGNKFTYTLFDHDSLSL